MTTELVAVLLALGGILGVAGALLVRRWQAGAVYPRDDLLREWLARAGLTSWHDLQRQAGLKWWHVSCLRRGQGERLPLEALVRVAKVLDVSLGQLVTRCTGLEWVWPEATVVRAQVQQEVLEKLKPLLVQYPTLAQVVQRQPTYPAAQVLALWTSVAHLLADWGCEPIGQPWQAVPFDPALHQPDEMTIQPGEMVYVRFVGYRWADGRVWLPAKVSRTLPPLVA